MEALTPAPPAGTYPSEKVLTMTREKYDEVIEKATARAGKTAKIEAACLKNRLALVLEELRLTKQLTAAYLKPL